MMPDAADWARLDDASAAPSRYIGIHAVVDVTGRDLDALHDALEALLCPPDQPSCALEMLSTTTHTDLHTVIRWVVGDES